MSLSVKTIQILTDLLNVKNVINSGHYTWVPNYMSYLINDLHMQNKHIPESDRILIDNHKSPKTTQGKVLILIDDIQLASRNDNKDRIISDLDSIKKDIGLQGIKFNRHISRNIHRHDLNLMLQTTIDEISNNLWDMAYKELSLINSYYGCGMDKEIQQIKKHSPSAILGVTDFKKHKLDDFIKKHF